MQQFLESESDGRIHIVVDQRESEEFDRALIALGAVVDRRTLDVGDFLCSARFVVERKTRSDFEASIIDGRLFSQLQNLRDNYDSIVIMIEGTLDEGRLSKNAILGAYASIISNYGASLIFTKDKQGSVELLYNFARHEQLSKNHPMRIYAKRRVFNSSQRARGVVESLPTIGPKIAKSLLKHFKTLEKLATASERDIAEVDGVGPKRAKLIRSLLSHEYLEDDDKSEY